MATVLLNLDDFESAARARLPRALYGFAANGSERGASVDANARSFARHAFAPRALVDVSAVSQTRSIFGESYTAPFGIAPMGGCALFAHEADLSLARAAHDSGIPFVLSAASSVPLEQVMEAAPRSWYQGYIPGDEARIDRLLARLQGAKVPVLVVTVDVPIASNRDKDRRLGFTIPLRPRLSLAIDGVLHPRWLLGTFARTLLTGGIPTLPNFGGDPTGRPIISAPTAAARSDRDRFTWAHIALIRRRWKGALVIKGILNADDAALARQAGVDGLVVSNHGGRQLDGAVAPLDALPGILDVAQGLPVCVDGGIRRGTDALKAIALGAHMVFVGRPMLYAVSVGGQAGVESAVRILQSEIRTSLALLGCTGIDGLQRTLLRPA
ncbi:alpha-hydroxy acid oxidase [Hydrogenophaga laconesensis]|uniref:L-lactate dehydrogenase (Cytochrome) n=1 Tax=Hydrogenophaga laconesensis TaxID=1805971 RepID=A0ABU1V7Z7_9BURK|nr:alpha-hydroxy acid oxidase [Hydrogenophaga laconesensis]MDR7093579.1 L-lactate dehydrogenase (cytochrome) [Hydrogenophaga laconesensis]